MTRDIFNDFPRRTSEILDEEETHYIIYDGAPANRGAMAAKGNVNRS